MPGIFEQQQNKSPIPHTLFGRKMLYTSITSINDGNLIKVLNLGLAYHTYNRNEIEYLENYYSGNQPVLERIKTVRPEINNKIVENFAFDAVEFHTAQSFGTAIKYGSANATKDVSGDINRLNRYMESESKERYDIELGEWQNISGTAYRFVLPDPKANGELDECPFTLDVLDPKTTFVVYSSRIGKPPLLGVRELFDENGSVYYECYSENMRYTVQNGKITSRSVNPIGMIPIIEYPKNMRRIGSIEITITITDAINTMQSNRLDGIEQFVQAFMKFVNCEIDKDTFLDMCNLGAIKIKGEPGLPADVDIVSSQLDQSNTQVSKDDLYKSFLIVQGMPSREQNTGGDTGSAVYLRNGWDFSESRTQLGDAFIKDSERQFLKVVLKILKVKNGFPLMPSDIQVDIARNQTYNIYTKSQSLQILLQSGIDEETAIGIIQLFSDPQKVYMKSKERMKALYDKTNDTSQNTVTGVSQNASATDTNTAEVQTNADKAS